MGNAWGVGKHRIRHSASGAGPRIIPGVGLLWVRGQTVLKHPCWSSGMKRTYCSLALALFLCTPAHSESGDELLQACEALERTVRISGDRVGLPARTDVYKCWGYMSAVQDFYIGGR